MRVGPSKEYGDTSTITLRFRTLGMTLSRGKLPQAGQNTLSPPLHSLFFLWNNARSLVHHRPVRSLVTSFFLKQNHFYQADNTYTHSLSFLSASHHLQHRLINDHDSSTRSREVDSPSNLIHFALSLPALVLQTLDIFSNFYAAPSFLFGMCRYVIALSIYGLRFISSINIPLPRLIDYAVSLSLAEFNA